LQCYEEEDVIEYEPEENLKEDYNPEEEEQGE
jgi:hypothetical protein